MIAVEALAAEEWFLQVEAVIDLLFARSESTLGGTTERTTEKEQRKSVFSPSC